MKKMLVLLLAALLAASLTLPALAEENPRLLKVDGHATVSLAADTATIQIGVNTKKQTVKEAQAENAQIMNAVLAALKNAGVEEKDIVTSNFNVNAEYEYSSGIFSESSRTQYYSVQNTVSVTLHDLTLIGKVLDAAMDAGANTTYGITFSSTQENAAYQKALTRAVEDAMQKAQVLAAAAQVELTGLVSMTTVDSGSSLYRQAYGVSNIYAYYDTAPAAAKTAITTGDVSVSAQVVLEYEFR